MNMRYSKFLTILLVVVIIAIIGLLGFWAYSTYQKYSIMDDASEAVDEFQHAVGAEPDDNADNETPVENATNPYDNLQSATDNNSTSDGNTVKTYKGFVQVGTIEIPKTGAKYPVLAEANKKTIEVAVAVLYGPGLNKTGNTTIVGHNYRNGMFFSDNKKIAVGDKIYITDLSGQRLTYIVYNTYETTAEDSDYMVRDTGGAIEISLSTCTDYDSSRRIIIWARAE